MQLLLNIQDAKVDFVIELLRNLSFVKTEKITPSKARFLQEFNEAIEEVTLAKRGKIKLKSAEQLLNEL